MENNTIITIGRQFGSGGSEIGKKLAARLSVPFYDRNLISMAAEKGGYQKEVLDGADENAANILLQSVTTASFFAGSRLSLPTEISLNDQLFIAQSEVIRDIAKKGSCVIVGRCADYVLREYKSCVNVFIYANLEARVRRVARLFTLSEDDAKHVVLKTDKKRAHYYNYYANRSWSNVSSYDLSVNSGCLGINRTVEALRSFAEAKDAAQPVELEL